MSEMERNRRVASRYLALRARGEKRPHVAASEAYLAQAALRGEIDDGQTMRRLTARNITSKGE